MEFWSAATQLQGLGITFQPRVIEGLAAIAVPGSRHVGRCRGAGVDGWGDVFKHANLAGTSPKGGVVVQAGMPILALTTVQEILGHGLHGIALSRFSGCWVAMKRVTDAVESASSVDLGLDRVKPVIPPVSPFAGGASIRLREMPQVREGRLSRARRPLSVGFARADRLNVVVGSAAARIGIITAGKSFADTMLRWPKWASTPKAPGLPVDGGHWFSATVRHRLARDAHWAGPGPAVGGR